MRPYAPRSTPSIAAPKRLGSLRDPEQRDADRHVGDAYHLLEAYGPTGMLNFELGSEVREALIEAVASKDDIPAIAETFRSESEGVRADLRGRSRGRFNRDVLYRMAQVGLDDTGLNRDAASEEILRVRWMSEIANDHLQDIPANLLGAEFDKLCHLVRATSELAVELQNDFYAVPGWRAVA